jgi:hypothetical protein
MHGLEIERTCNHPGKKQNDVKQPNPVIGPGTFVRKASGLVRTGVDTLLPLLFPQAQGIA